MADRKISDLTALTTPAAGDYLPIVDVSEASASNKNKRITIEELLRGAPDGTAAAPSIGFESDGGNGLYLAGTDTIGVSTNGVNRLTLDTAAFSSTLPIVYPLGAAAAPSITFTGDLNTGLWSPTADTLAVSTGGSERLRITSTGQVRLAGAGITFNGDTAAANELDDYEEGTWSPSFLGSTTNPTQTYNLRLGRYVKIGRSVFITCRLLMVNSGISGGTGDLFVGDLPFTSANVSDQFWGISAVGSSLSTAVTGGTLINNDNKIYLLASDSLATTVSASVVTNNSAIVITGWYEV